MNGKGYLGSSNIVQIKELNRSFNNIKQVSLLECIHVDVQLSTKHDQDTFWLSFSNTPLIYLNYSSDQRLNLICETASFNIINNEISKLSLLKWDKSSSKDSYCLAIPLNSIENIRLSKFKRIESSDEFDHLLALLNAKILDKAEGFVIPLKNLYRTNIQARSYKFFSYINSNKPVAKEIMKARHISCDIAFFNYLTKIKQLFPEYVYRANYTIFNSFESLLENSWSYEFIDDQDFNKLSFSSIKIYLTLSDRDFEFICKLLSSNKTRFRLSYIWLNFKKLSEWLTVLDLCEECPQLEYIYLKYSDQDLESSLKDEAISKFRMKFWFIRELKIIGSIK